MIEIILFFNYNIKWIKNNMLYISDETKVE